MKPVVTDYESRVYCARIEPVGSHPIVRLAGYPTDVTMTNGNVYMVESGYEFSGFASGTTFASPNIDLSGILQSGAITENDLKSGIYDNARVYLFATSWVDGDSIEDEEPISMFFFGKTDFANDRYTVQLMGAIDALSQNVGRTYSPSCPWTLFDQSIDGRVISASTSKCTGPRSAPDGPNINTYKVTGALTSVTSQYIFADSGRGESADWFGYGEIMFTTGENAGLRPSQIKEFAAGVIELHEALFYMPEVGDEYVMIPGCRKRLAEDCIGKFNNAINNGGHAHVPAPSEYSQVGRGA